MTKVLGIDIGAKFVVAFCLESLPVGMSYKDYYKRNAKVAISKIRMDNKVKDSDKKIKDAIQLLKDINPTAIVMEPTGVWYSKLWAKIAEHLGIEVKWIGHSDLAFNRGAYGFEDKDDRTDAFCLAVSYFHPDYNNQHKWINWRAGLIAEVNDRSLELESLDSTSIVFTQQLRQRLKYEFPECADRAISNSRTKYGFTAWVGWLAGIHNSAQIQFGYNKSIAIELGITITQYTRDHAAALAGNQIREIGLEADLRTLLNDPEFDRYRETLEKFGFGIKMQGTILISIYPFEKFLRDDLPYIERWQDDVKWHKKNRSLGGFQISLGMGKRLVESGGSTARIYAGSSFARTKLYCWIMRYVVPERMADSWLVTELDRRSMTNPRTAVKVADLRKRWQTTKGSNKDRHQAGAAIAMTLAYRVTRLIYDQLLRSCQS